jgi:hypothetical protein
MYINVFSLYLPYERLVFYLTSITCHITTVGRPSELYSHHNRPRGNGNSQTSAKILVVYIYIYIYIYIKYTCFVSARGTG